MEIIKKIGIWGDSILKGVVFDEAVGKYRSLKNCAVNLIKNRNLNIDIKNNSRFGCTAPKAEKNLEQFLNDGYRADLVLLEFGGNDCDYNWAEVSADPDSEHSPNTPLSKFIDSMHNMINLLIKHKIQPVLMNLPPISAEKYFDWITKPDNVNPDNVLHWLKEKYVIYRQQENYSHAIDNMAREYNIPLIDVREPFLEIRDYDNYLCVDGIHLNEKGQALMSRTIEDFAHAKNLAIV
ncbi:MAG: SGNH/GDSL hydrolase family protein [Acutalibacteraceae bacterium]